MLSFFKFLGVIFALLDQINAQINADPDTDPDPKPCICRLYYLGFTDSHSCRFVKKIDLHHGSIVPCDILDVLNGSRQYFW
jgi:hypothetical protein